MKIKFFLIITTFSLIALNSISQDVNSIINEGVILHDQGNYDDAIKKYKEALHINKEDMRAIYELSYTYLQIEDYKNAKKYSQKLLESNSDYAQHGYIVFGAALDMLGKTKKSIKVYKEAIHKYPNNYLLYYNLALSCLNLSNLDEAEEYAIEAIQLNKNHSSSHLVLANIMYKKQCRIKSTLALYYFLLLEPDSPRSLHAYNFLLNQLDSGVEKKEDKSFNLNVPASADSDKDFAAAEMMVSMLGLSNNLEKNKNKNDLEILADNNNSLFIILGELKKDNEGFWWDFYVDFFYAMAKSGSSDTFTYYISQSRNSEPLQVWLREETERINQFIKWFKE